jgi:serine protease Do
LIGFCSLQVHAAVSPQLQQPIRVSTFEVVMKKPEKDTATYEKPLPMDLLPYRERTDAYQSIGTAFSLGHNTYVTAAHVLGLGIDSQYGKPELRGSDGTVYAIDRIERFSLHEDFVVFSPCQSRECSRLRNIRRNLSNACLPHCHISMARIPTLSKMRSPYR